MKQVLLVGVNWAFDGGVGKKQGAYSWYKVEVSQLNHEFCNALVPWLPNLMKVN